MNKQGILHQRATTTRQRLDKSALVKAHILKFRKNKPEIVKPKNFFLKKKQERKKRK